MLRRRKRTRRAPMLAPLMLLLAGCASELPSWSPPVDPPTIPPLPAEAQQPEIPLMCLPTCSAGLTKERENLLSMPIGPGSQAKHANGHTSR